MVWTGTFDGRMEKQFSESANWRNTLKLAFGQTHQQDRRADGSLFWRKPDKTDYLIEFESLFRWTRPSGWDPFLGLKFNSMFQDLTDPYGRSISLNPITVAPSAGMSRTLVDQEHRKLMARIGIAYLLNSRAFFTELPPSTATERKSSDELAAEAVLEYKVGALDKRVDWDSKLTLTLPFVYSGKKIFQDDLTAQAIADAGLPADVANYTTTLDVDWENTFSANITRIIGVKLYVRWVYDKYDNTVVPVVDNGTLTNPTPVIQAIRKAGQFKETMALAMTYKF